ncbi:MAG: adenylate/guanylate cyclase domain-containing protein [Rhizobiaceae bacterium]
MQTVDRRLAAILAADIAGYSRLMSLDEEGTIAQLRTMRADIFEPHLTAHHGRIANTAGDSFLIEFGSAVEALRYAMAVQSDIALHNENVVTDRRLEFRIGINLGDVVAEGTDLLGDGVNVAARIEALAQPGGICISRSVCDQVRDRLDVALVDLGETKVKNIDRPVHVFQVDLNGEAQNFSISKQRASALSGRPPSFLAAIVLLAAVAAAIGWYGFLELTGGNVTATGPAATPTSSSQSSPSPSQSQSPSRPSIAVLPFENQSDDPEQGYFARGIWEDVTTDLSRVSGLLVTSSSAAARFKPGASSTGPKAIGQALGVRHLLEGSVRRSGDKLRISTRLTDAASGKQIWAERYDRDAKDLFAIQDEISERVVNQLSALFSSAGLARAPRGYTPKLEAYDFYIKGRAQRIPPTPKNIAAAFQSFDQAIAIDPKFAGGYAGAAMAQVLAAFAGGGDDESYQKQLQSALELANKAVALDPQFGPGWGSLAEVRFKMGQFDEALTAIRTAIEKAPSDSLMRANYGRYLGYLRRGAEGREQVKTALRMSPDSLPLLYFLAINLRAEGEALAAVETLLEHRKRLGGRVLPAPTAQLIAAQVQAGKLEDARLTSQALLKGAPWFTARLALRTHTYQHKEDAEEFVDLLVQAGIRR